MVKQIRKERKKENSGYEEGKQLSEIQIRQIVVKCKGANHERMQWTFNAYEVFLLVKNIGLSETELCVLLASPQDAINAALNVVKKRKYVGRNGIILSWKCPGFSKTQQTLIRARGANFKYKKIDPKGNALLSENKTLKFADVEKLTPLIKVSVVTEEHISHNGLKLQKVGDGGGDVME